MRLDQAAVGHDHAELGGRIELEQIIDAIRHGQTQLERGGLDRSGQQFATAPASLVGGGHDEGDVVTGIDEGAQGGHRHRRRPEVDDPQRSCEP